MYCYKCGKYTETDETLCPECKAKENKVEPQVIVGEEEVITPTEEETKGITAGQILANHNIAVESMGFGKDDVNFPYLQKISSFSGGITTLISYPDEFESVFASMFVQSQSIIVTNVKLVIRLTSGTRILDYYRGTPDNVFLGNREDVDDKILKLNLGQIEKTRFRVGRFYPGAGY